jgi:hypothetical protein
VFLLKSRFKNAVAKAGFVETFIDKKGQQNWPFGFLILYPLSKLHLVSAGLIINNGSQYG